MVKIKDTILETTIQYSVISVLAIIGTALTIVLTEIGDLFLVKVYPDISKKLLSELLLIALALCLILAAYIFALRNKLKKSWKEEFKIRFGIYWDNELNPHCPNCKTLLSNYDESENMNPSFYCSQCKDLVFIKDETGKHLTQIDAMAQLSKK